MLNPIRSKSLSLSLNQNMATSRKLSTITIFGNYTKLERNGNREDGMGWNWKGMGWEVLN